MISEPSFFFTVFNTVILASGPDTFQVYRECGQTPVRKGEGEALKPNFTPLQHADKCSVPLNLRDRPEPIIVNLIPIMGT